MEIRDALGRIIDIGDIIEIIEFGHGATSRDVGRRFIVVGLGFDINARHKLYTVKIKGLNGYIKDGNDGNPFVGPECCLIVIKNIRIKIKIKIPKVN